MKITGTLLAVHETEYWDQDLLDRYGIAAMFGLYVILDDGLNTVDVAAHCVENVPMFWIETPEHVREATHEELAGTSEPRDYLMRDTLACDPRFKVRLEVEDDEDGERHPGADLDALLESIHTGCEDEPAILDYATWAAWRQECIDKRRSRNLPPVSNWGANGTENLPLYVHAANAMVREHMPALKRLDRMKGGCAASQMLKRRLTEAGMHWPV